MGFAVAVPIPHPPCGGRRRGFPGTFGRVRFIILGYWGERGGGCAHERAGGSRVDAARTWGGWKRWTGAVRLGLAVLACAFAGEGAAQTYTNPDKESTWSAGKRFRDCAECPLMVVVPGGSFDMGSPESEAGRDSDEGPVHRVRIERPFAVGVYELTFAEWDACVSGGGCGGYRPSDAGWGRGNRPVIRVSWEDAKAYVRWLSEETGEEYRLLSESEWEYVARAGTRTPFHTGETISTGQANYDGRYTYGSGRKGRYRGRTVVVGSFDANGYGLHDVHGNVMEWVEDCWNDDYRGAPADGSAWETGDCKWRMLRDGSWYFIPGWIRSAARSWAVAGIQLAYAGFRVARTLTP